MLNCLSLPYVGYLPKMTPATLAAGTYLMLNLFTYFVHCDRCVRGKVESHVTVKDWRLVRR